MRYSVKIEKGRDYSPMPGCGSSEFYGYAYVDNKRVGTVWKFRDGHYVMNEDFNNLWHSREKRPKQFSARRLSELKRQLQEFQWDAWRSVYVERLV